MVRETKYNKSLEFAFNQMEHDIKELIEKLTPHTLNPLLIVIFTYIDFMGGLVCGFSDFNSKFRSTKFMRDYMSCKNPKYSNSEFSNFLYDDIRCVLIHRLLAKRFWNRLNRANKFHFSIMAFDEFDTTFIHPGEFKNEFLAGLTRFKEHLKFDSGFRKNVLKNYRELLTSTVKSTERCRTFKRSKRFKKIWLKKLDIKKVDTNNLTETDFDNFIGTIKNVETVL